MSAGGIASASFSFDTRPGTARWHQHSESTTQHVRAQLLARRTAHLLAWESGAEGEGVVDRGGGVGGKGLLSMSIVSPPGVASGMQLGQDESGLSTPVVAHACVRGQKACQ